MTSLHAKLARLCLEKQGGAAQHAVKSATRFAPGVGAITGGAFAAYNIHQDKSEMKSQYNGIISNFFKRIGEFISPSEVTYSHVKQYSKANPIVGEEINDMWSDAGKDVGYGALGFAGSAMQIAEEGYNAYNQNFTTAEWVDILDDYASKGGKVDASHIMLLADETYKNDPKNQSENLTEAQWKSREQVASLCADKINSGEMTFTDMAAFIGEGEFVRQSQQYDVQNLCQTEELQCIIEEYRGEVFNPHQQVQRSLDDQLAAVQETTFVNQNLAFIDKIEFQEVDDCCQPSSPAPHQPQPNQGMAI